MLNLQTAKSLKKSMTHNQILCLTFNDASRTILCEENCVCDYGFQLFFSEVNVMSILHELYDMVTHFTKDVFI